MSCVKYAKDVTYKLDGQIEPIPVLGIAGDFVKKVTLEECKPFFNSHSEMRRMVHTNPTLMAQKMAEQDILIRRMAATIEALTQSLWKMKDHTFRFFPMPFGCKAKFMESPMFKDTEEAENLLNEA